MQGTSDKKLKLFLEKENIWFVSLMKLLSCCSGTQKVEYPLLKQDMKPGQNKIFIYNYRCIQYNIGNSPYWFRFGFPNVLGCLVLFPEPNQGILGFS